jgi:hypothetical protein
MDYNLNAERESIPLRKSMKNIKKNLCFFQEKKVGKDISRIFKAQTW